jgi:hypothetical protein
MRVRSQLCMQASYKERFEQALLLVKLKKSGQRNWLTYESLAPNLSTDNNKHHT